MTALCVFQNNRGDIVDIYVYGDESGTLDAAHSDFFAFGGLVCFGRESKDSAIRRYLAAERAIASAYPPGTELKAAVLSPKHKMSLFRATRRMPRFACVIDQKRVDSGIMADKKNRQRFLDFAFKVALKRYLLGAINDGMLREEEIGDILVVFDEHKTATSGRYELQESIGAEFKRGVVAHDGHYIPPVFPDMGDVKTRFVDSRNHALVRAADIVANVMLHKALEGKLGQVPRWDVFTTHLP